MNSDDYLSTLLTEGPPAARCELVRHLPSDDFGPRVLGRLRHDDQPITVRGIAIADAAWTRAAKRLQALACVRVEQACTLLAYGRHEGLAYFIHAHEGGPRLTTLLREHDGRLPLAVILPIFAQLLIAVGEAHRQDVVVGGIRPQDVRVMPEGEGYRVLVRNLGLAAVLGVPAGRRGSTDHPSIYRAPEPDVSKLPASDVFSLGVLFIRLLTGPLPRSASDAERYELLCERLREILAEDPEVTDGLVTMLYEAIDPDVEMRPRDATRLLEALLEVVPASDLRLPGAMHEPAVDVEEDAPRQWPARQWTMLNEWDRPREPTPVPRAFPLFSEPVPGVITKTEPATVVPSFFEQSAVARPPKARTIEARAFSRRVPQAKTVRAPWVQTQSPRGIRRFAVGAGVSAFAAAVALVIAVGEPSTSIASLPTASLSALPTQDADPEAVPRIESEPEPVQSAVVIETNPPGVLTIDGRKIGATPLRADIPPGRHVVRVEADGHQTWRSRIEVAAGQEHRVAVTLLPEPS